MQACPGGAALTNYLYNIGTGPVKFNLVRGWASTINSGLPGLLQLIWPYPGFYTALAVVAQHLIVAVAAQQLTHCRL